jgi:hypothetical protein
MGRTVTSLVEFYHKRNFSQKTRKETKRESEKVIEGKKQ